MMTPELEQYKMARVIRPNSGAKGVAGTTHITSLSFHESGESLVAGCESSEQIHVITGMAREEGPRLVKTVDCGRTGVRCPVSTHHDTCIIYGNGRPSVSNNNYEINYLSLYDDAVLKKLEGHRRPIDSVSFAPDAKDIILSSARDGVRLWDLNSPGAGPMAALRVDTNRPCLSAFDPQGLVFAVATEDRYIRLYDRAEANRGPFAAWDIVDPYASAASSNQEWIQVSFSPDGKLLLVNTKEGRMYIVDSFEGHIKAVLSTAGQGLNGQAFYAAWAPDSCSLLCGCADGRIAGWRLREDGTAAGPGTPHFYLEGHTLAPLAIAFNPRLPSLASACSNVALWLRDRQ